MMMMADSSQTRFSFGGKVDCQFLHACWWVAKSTTIRTYHFSDTKSTVALLNGTSIRVSYLVSWRFEPSQPQRITLGLNTNYTLSLSYSFQKSFYHKSCFLNLFKFRGHLTREPASNRVTYFILRAYTGTG